MSALAVISACSKENNPQQEEQGGKFAFTAGFSDPSDPSTKVFLEHNYYYKELYVLWEKGDQVTVNDGTNNAVFESDRTGFSTSLLASDASTFDQDAPVYCSLFPHDPEAVFSQEGSLQYVTTTLPATQYARRDAFSSHIAVSSTTQSQKAFMYKNVTAVFKATITTEGVESLVFTGKNNENVAGKIRVNIETAEYSLIDSPSSTVTVLPPQGRDTFEPGRYYFTILPQTFASGFTVTIAMDDGVTTEVRDVSGTNIEIRRSSLSIGKAIGTEGEGTQQKPYLIRNKYDFEGIATIVADDDIPYGTTTYIRIEEDIDLKTIKSWTPINNSRDPQYIAKLDIDGNYKTIENFAPADFAEGIGVPEDGLDHNQPSLFGIIYGTVKNLKVENADLTNAGTSSVGILAGYVGFEDMSATISNVKVSGKLSGKRVIGGIAGHARNATFVNCIAEVEITAAELHAGGLVGRYNENVSFVDCRTIGSVSGTRGVGGLIGFNSTKSAQTIIVENCVSECTVNGNYQVGGLVGHTQSPMNISGCYVSGDVTATSRMRSDGFMQAKQVGGIIGVGAEEAVNVTECRYDGDISADGDFVGGIMGLNTGSAAITNCHANCSIVNTGQYHADHPNVNYDMIGVGGILGGSRGTSLNVSSCFVDEGTLSSKALGTMTAHPEDWSSWAASVKNQTGGYKGGAVGGVVGYVAEGAGNVTINHNVTWITSITCKRDNIYDAPCAPIVGCISSEFGDVFKDNRYYKNSAENLITITDACEGYQMRALVGQATISVLNVIEEDGEVPNWYCLFCRPVSNSGHAKGENAPSMTAETYFTSDKWNKEGYKPYLEIPVAPEFDEVLGTQLFSSEDYMEL